MSSKTVKLCMLLFVVVFSASNMSAQSWIIEETFGGDAEDRAYNLVSHANGNVTHIGYTNSFGDPAFYPNVHIVQSDPVGATIRELVYDVRVAVPINSSVYETELSIFECANGDFVWTTGVVPTPGSQADILVVRTNAAGGVIWSTYVGANNGGDDFSTSIIETQPSGDLLITGYTDAQPTAGNYDIIAARLNSAGALLWGSKYGSGNGDYGRCIRELTNGNFVIVGETVSFTLPSDGIQLAIDGGGALLWSWSHGTNTNPQGFSCTVQHPGNGFIYTTGVYWHTLTASDVWIAVTDPLSGALLTSARYSATSTGLEGGWFIDNVPGPAGDLVIGGVRPGNSAPTTDGFFMLVSSFLGVPSQYRIYGTNNTNEEIRCVAHTAGNAGVPFTQGGFWSVGFTNAAGSGNYDHYLLRSNLVGKTGCDMQDGMTVHYPQDSEFIQLTSSGFDDTEDASVIDRSVLSLLPFCAGQYVSPMALKSGASPLHPTEAPLVLNVTVYPQPVQVGSDVSIEVEIDRAAQLSVVLRDVTGRTVFSTSQQAEAGSSILRLKLSELGDNLSSGVYTLQINGMGQTYATSLMVVN